MTTRDRGHLFVLRGDLTRLACDAVILPADGINDVTRAWEPLLRGRVSDPRPGSSRVRVTVDPDSEGRTVRYVHTLEPGPAVWLVDSARPEEPEQLARRVGQAVLTVARTLRRKPKSKRARHLIGIPVVGVGEGGHGGNRGAVVRALLREIEALDREADVALVVQDERDFAAAQRLRRTPNLVGGLNRKADELAERASANALALFLGAGVSLAAGLPSWKDLVKDLEREAGVSRGAFDRVPALDAAEAASTLMELRVKDAEPRAKRKRGAAPAFERYLASRFELERPALAHYLLAGLNVECAVTTNYDNGYESAMKAATGRSAQVIPRQRAKAGSPWLLKLHGDIEAPGSFVLTRQHYLDLAESGAPLIGMVQSLLMTRHVLFVGYSMVDDDFAKLARQVERVLEQHDNGSPVGTVLLLAKDEVRTTLWGDSLEHVAMRARSEAEAARQLEIFLDRVLWKATISERGSDRYALDPRYARLGDRDGSRKAAARVREVFDGMTPTQKRSDVGTKIAGLIERLGGEIDRDEGDSK